MSTLVPERPERKAGKFPRVTPHAPDTMQTPSPSSLSLVGRVKQFFWRLSMRLKQTDLLYSLKAGLATAILAAPAFFDASRPLFVEYRGEWALISFFVVISPTIGGTNFLSLHRILGTIVGAIVAVLAYAAFHDAPVLLAIFGFFFSLPCFYYIVGKPVYASSGRFVLLTYNLTCLYCYNIRDRDIWVLTIAFHRVVAVTIGVVWALVVSRYWWPIEARRELSKGLSEFCLNLAWLYSRMISNYSGPVTNFEQSQTPRNISSRTPLLSFPKLSEGGAQKLNSSIQDFMAMELHLQLKLIKLQGLLAQTSHEPRLKGPFPVKLYRSMLTSLQTILDNMHSMRCVTTREEWLTVVRRDFIVPVYEERKAMVGNIILYFSTLSAAFHLKTPLPPYLPPAEKSRQNLVRAIRDLEIVKAREIKASRHLLYFAYVIVMKGVISELETIGRTLQDAFGVLGGSIEEFEHLFRAEALEREEESPP